MYVLLSGIGITNCVRLLVLVVRRRRRRTSSIILHALNSYHSQSARPVIQWSDSEQSTAVKVLGCTRQGALASWAGERSGSGT